MTDGRAGDIISTSFLRVFSVDAAVAEVGLAVVV